MSIGFISAKGGQGVTVTAATYALIMSQQHQVCLVPTDDTRAALGMADSAVEVNDNLRLVDTPDEWILTVLDGQPGDETILVTTSCYMALRRAVRMLAQPDAPKLSGIIVIEEPGRAITADDVERTIGAKVLAIIPRDPVIARAVDAGLLASRVPSSIRHPLARVGVVTTVRQRD